MTVCFFKSLFSLGLQSYGINPESRLRIGLILISQSMKCKWGSRNIVGIREQQAINRDIVLTVGWTCLHRDFIKKILHLSGSMIIRS
jgi:hypothetical protein